MMTQAHFSDNCREQGLSPPISDYAGLSNRWMLVSTRTFGMAVGFGIRRFVKRLRRNRVDFAEV
jgi:hypothetical protein